MLTPHPANAIAAFMQPHTTPDMASMVDTPEDELREIAARYVPREMLDVIPKILHEAARKNLIERMGIGCEERALQEMTRRILMVIGDGRNSGVRAWCVDFLAGTGVFGGLSETEIGRKWGVHRATISRICKDLQSVLGMSPAPGGKRDHASLVYHFRAKANHAEGKIKRQPRTYAGATKFRPCLN